MVEVTRDALLWLASALAPVVLAACRAQMGDPPAFFYVSAGGGLILAWAALVVRPSAARSALP
jgi:hypothetical protein